MLRARSACPLLTTGGLLEYLKRRTDPNEYLVYFMPTTPGNCRFTQYNVFLKKLIQKNKIENVAFLSLTNENGYAGMAMTEVLNALKSMIVSDVMEDVKNALAVLARDKAGAMKVFETQWEKIKVIFSEKRGKGLYNALEDVRKSSRPFPFAISYRRPRSFHFLGKFSSAESIFHVRTWLNAWRSGTSSRNALTCWNGSRIAITT